jgi:hypothetical protein
MKTAALAATLGLAFLAVSSIPTAHGQIAVRNQGYMPFTDPPINYRSMQVSDPVARLQQQLARGTVKLDFESDHGYLRSVLQLLKVPVDSQTLVFSKTSFQYPKISPDHPRALYFNDDVYVGSVHEGKAIEIISFDPRQGAIFYLLDERKVDHPTFQRAELDCSQCHIAAGTRGVPGVFLRSVYPTSRGTLALSNKTFITDQESPFSQRWGGWYVTGDSGIGAHLGNVTVEDTQQSATGDVPVSALKWAPLGKPFNAGSYLFSDGSDVVAHLVLAHQTQMHNLITLVNYKTRLALYSRQSATGGTAASDGLTGDQRGLTDDQRQQFEAPAEQLLRYLLFVKEAPLSAGGGAIGGSSAFAHEFATRGPRDAKGRSLRDFDLRTRIFRYPCSYLIYSESFDALPEPAKSYVYHRLLQILSGQDPSPDFAGLLASDRRAILEILLATKTGLPEEWRVYASTNHLLSVEHSQTASAPAHHRNSQLLKQ